MKVPRRLALWLLALGALSYAQAQVVKQGGAANPAAGRQQTTAAAARTGYDASHFAALVRNIADGDNSGGRRQAITRELAGLRISYESQTFEYNGVKGTNILASLPAPRPGAPVLMMGAHFDRVEQGKGAVDNAAGVSVVLELLASFRRSPLKDYRVVAAFWDGEEQGLAGSRWFVSSVARDQMPAIYLNFDVLPYGDTLCANWKDASAKSARAFRAATADGIPLVTEFTFPPSDDRPFVAAGVEVVAVALADTRDIEEGMKMLRGNPQASPRIMRIMHTAQDTPDKISPGDVCKALPIIERAIRLMTES